MRIAFAGTPEFAVPTLRALAGSGHELIGVLTQPDRPSGRGRLVAPSPVKQAALALGLPVSQPATLSNAVAGSDLLAWRADLLVVVAYGLILPPGLLRLPRLGCLNVHASLLPRWRGAAPIERAILAGDTETGVTIMQMDAGLDTGPVLLERRVPIGRTATGGSLHDQLATLGAAALLDALRELEAGTARPRPQSAVGVTYAAKIGKAEALVDWHASALAIERKVRAFNPRPVAETRLRGEPLRILAARALGCAESGASETGAGEAGGDAREPVDIRDGAGTLLGIERGAILVRCGQGVLAITELQRPGRRPVTAKDFINAVPLAPGWRLG